ncbi:MAG: hypothetical protein Q9188_005957 [Gyalolechia gomerana]
MAAAQSLLSTRSFQAVLAVDGGIAVRRNNALQQQTGKLRQTCKFVRPRDMDKLGNQRAAGLEREYSANALHSKNVPLGSKAYVPLGQSMVESRVFVPSPANNGQTLAAFYKYGDRWLGYIGDMNNEAGSQSLLMALLRRSCLGLAHQRQELLGTCQIRICTELTELSAKGRSDFIDRRGKRGE